MSARIPITLITGALGSGKTTLLRHILECTPKKMAILMNEFGQIAIDSRIIAGKNVRMAELAGGCVCCSLLGEFEAAVAEIIDTVDPDWIVIETTGLAEPDALISDIQESIPGVRLDGIVTLIDSEALFQYPSWGPTTRLQVEAADLLLFNKADLISLEEMENLVKKLKEINPQAACLRTVRSQVDPDLLFGIGRERALPPTRHVHQPEFESFQIAPEGTLERRCFEEFAAALGQDIYRIKGFVRFSDGTYLFNFVAGRWEFEPFAVDEHALVFIGREALKHRSRILEELRGCVK